MFSFQKMKKKKKATHTQCYYQWPWCLQGAGAKLNEVPKGKRLKDNQT